MASDIDGLVMATSLANKLATIGIRDHVTKSGPEYGLLVNNRDSYWSGHRALNAKLQTEQKHAVLWRDRVNSYTDHSQKG